MIGEVIRRGLPHLPGVSHLHVNKPQIFKKLITRKPKGNHRAYKEWAPSVKLLQKIWTELYMQKSMAELQ